jgi:hypothetical protein
LREIACPPGRESAPLGPSIIQRLHDLGDNDAANRLAILDRAFDDPCFRVVVFGEFNRGKSTLINALLGRFVLPAKLVPTTGHVTRLLHGSPEQVHVRLRDGQSLTCELEQLGDFAALNRDGAARDDIETIEVAVQSPILADGLALIDTPGVNEREAQTRRARSAIELADLVLLLLDARQLLAEHERKLAADWLGGTLGKTVVPVVNFMNLVEEQERAGLRERMDRWCLAHLQPEFGRGWFEVNALGALAHALGKQAPPCDDFHALLSLLKNCNRLFREPSTSAAERMNRDRMTTEQPRLSRLKRTRLRQLLVELHECRKRNDHASEQMRDNLARVSEERQQRRELLRRLAARFDAETPVQRERLLHWAAKLLAGHLEALVANSLTGRDRRALQDHAARWYREYLTDAIQSIERNSAAMIHQLADAPLRRPEPFTIRERMMLSARPQQPLVDLEDADLAFRMSVGDAIGTFVLPLPFVGETIGNTVLHWLRRYLSFKAQTYCDMAVEQARTRWNADAGQVMAILQAQYDARSTELRRELLEKLALAEVPFAAATEALQREELSRALEDCEKSLVQWGELA